MTPPETGLAGIELGSASWLLYYLEYQAVFTGPQEAPVACDRARKRSTVVLPLLSNLTQPD